MTATAAAVIAMAIFFVACLFVGCSASWLIGRTAGMREADAARAKEHLENSD